MTELQEQNIQILDTKGAPPELVRIARRAALECKKVKSVIFDAFIEDLNGNLGAYNPDSQTVVVDMGSCIKTRTWMEKGILLIPNVWFNLLYAFFHEMAHAFQLEEDPELLEFDELPQEYEDEAHVIAKDSLLEWAKNGTIPRLNELGWVGDQLKSLFNQMYVQTPDIVIEELAIEGTAAAANALHVALTKGTAEDPVERNTTLQSIDDGLIGLKVNGKRYLTAYEAIDTTHECHIRR